MGKDDFDINVIIRSMLKGDGLDLTKQKARSANTELDRVTAHFKKINMSATTAMKSSANAMKQTAGAAQKLGQSVKNVAIGSQAANRLFGKVQQSMMLQGRSAMDAGSAINQFKGDMNALGIGIRKVGKGSKATTEFFNKLSGSTLQVGNVARQAGRYSLRQFKGHLLSLMFIGQSVARTFGGMIKTVLQMTGMFDLWRGVLASILLPILMPLISKWLPRLMAWLEKPGVKKMVGYFILFAAAIGTVVATLMPFGILFGSLGITLGHISTLIGIVKGSLSGFVAAFAVLASGVVILNGIFNVFVGILEGKVWPVLKGVLKIAGGLMLMMGGPWVAAIGAIVIAVSYLADHLSWLKGILLSVGGAVSWFIELIATAISKVAGLIGLGSGKSFMGTFSSKAFSGATKAFSGVPELAGGGLITKPTLALLGERGPEAVVPLDRSSAGMGTEINYNPTINVRAEGASMADIDLIVREVNSRLFQDLRRIGAR